MNDPSDGQPRPAVPSLPVTPPAPHRARRGTQTMKIWPTVGWSHAGVLFSSGRCPGLQRAAGVEQRSSALRGCGSQGAFGCLLPYLLGDWHFRPALLGGGAGGGRAAHLRRPGPNRPVDRAAGTYPALASAAPGRAWPGITVATPPGWRFLITPGYQDIWHDPGPLPIDEPQSAAAPSAGLPDDPFRGSSRSTPRPAAPARLPRTALRFTAGDARGRPTASNGQGPYPPGRLAPGRTSLGGNGKRQRWCPAR